MTWLYFLSKKKPAKIKAFQKSHFFVVFASNDAGVSRGSQILRVDFHPEEDVSGKLRKRYWFWSPSKRFFSRFSELSAAVVRSAALGFSTNQTFYSLFWEWNTSNSPFPMKQTLFFCSSKTSFTCSVSSKKISGWFSLILLAFLKDGLFWKDIDDAKKIAGNYTTSLKLMCNLWNAFTF